MTADERTECSVKFLGRVQGVGFRLTARQLAPRFGITGTVSNLPDGSVEIVAQGERAAVDRFVAAVEDRMSGYIVRSIKIWRDPRQNYLKFSILA